MADSELVFQTVTGLSPGRRNAHRAISQAGIRAGLSPKGAKGDALIGPHDLRHSAAAVARENPALSSAYVTRLLRHANERVTQTIYGGRQGTDVEQAQSLRAKLAGSAS